MRSTGRSATGGPSPVSPAHLLSVTAIFESLVAEIEAAAGRARRGARPVRPRTRRAPRRRHRRARLPRAEICAGPPAGAGHRPRRRPRRRSGRAVGERRSEPTAWMRRRSPARTSWCTPPRRPRAAMPNISATPSTPRATCCVPCTRRGVTRLVLVSSLSVLEPPPHPVGAPGRADAAPGDPRALGAYTWGKCLQEELVDREAPALGIATRIIRPGALIDWRDPALPGLMGRRLFGRWHLALGRPGLPIAVCGLDRCAEAIAWCAAHFDEAPPILNLVDTALGHARRGVVARLRAVAGTRAGCSGCPSACWPPA